MPPALPPHRDCWACKTSQVEADDPCWPSLPGNVRAVPRQVLTHQVSIDRARAVVTKRFIHRDRHEPEREWRALLLLAEHAPGLAPQPLRADLRARLPMIEMSLLPGEPLSAAPMSATQQSALVSALLRLWESVPVSEVRPEPGESSNRAQLVAAVRAHLAAGHDLGSDPVVATALTDGCKWFASLPERADGVGLPPVFGQNDSNLANFLWDGDRVRLVDFEDSGRSDRVFELAVLVEHLGVWHDAGLDADRLIAAFDGLPAAAAATLVEDRRLAALLWLLLLRPSGGASRRNPPGTLRRQAERLLALL
jgi:Phosphotransferase enzyme family